MMIDRLWEVAPGAFCRSNFDVPPIEGRLWRHIIHSDREKETSQCIPVG
jgi:hypothetical protein